jgi:hypothetical protein
VAATLEEEDAARMLLSVSESLFFSSTTDSSMVRGVWSASPAMEWEVGAAQQAVKAWEARVRNDGT